MKLVASMICRDELDRYLELAVEHALTYCDEVAIWDDGSEVEIENLAIEDAGVLSDPRVHVAGRPHMPGRGPHFEHEGRARQALLEHTMTLSPTHVIVIDADEFITDGVGLRDGLERGEKTVYRVCMEEVWNVRADSLDVRCDGGWVPHPVPIVYRAPAELYGSWRIADSALACRREPVAVDGLIQQRDVVELPVSIWHFGWAAPAEREQRYRRYVDVDGGRFHRNAHILSIAWDQSKMDLERVPWPKGLSSVRDRLLERTQRDVLTDAGEPAIVSE